MNTIEISSPLRVRTAIVRARALCRLSGLALAFAVLSGVDFSSAAERDSVGNVSATVRLVIGATESPGRPHERLAALRRLPGALAPADVGALLGFATGARPADLSSAHWRVFMNDIFDQLLQQKSVGSNVGRGLVDLAESAEDPVIRDYAIQKLGSLVGVAADEPLRHSAMNTLKRAAALSGSDFQGTALLAWQRLDAGAKPGDPELRKAIAACLSSSESTAPARCAALQAAAACGFDGAVQPARRYLREPGTAVIVRVSSLAALGELGDAGDAELIRTYSDDAVCQAAAQTALRKLARR